MVMAEFDDMNDGDMKNSNLEGLRHEIDLLDQTILEAVSDRLGLTSRIAAAKHDDHIFRPGREADLLRHLLAKTKKNIDPQLVESLWRRIIAFSLAGQKQLTIAHTENDGTAVMAHYRFGEVAQYLSHNHASSVLDCITSGKADLGVLPHWEDEPWWRDLAVRRSAGDGIAIASAIPLVAESSLHRSAVIASYMPDPSEDDVTICHENGDIVTLPGYHPDRPNVLGIFQQQWFSAIE
jgi:chorismate mutase